MLLLLSYTCIYLALIFANTSKSVNEFELAIYTHLYAKQPVYMIYSVYTQPLYNCMSFSDLH